MGVCKTIPKHFLTTFPISALGPGEPPESILPGGYGEHRGRDKNKEKKKKKVVYEQKGGKRAQEMLGVLKTTRFGVADPEIVVPA